MHIYFMGIGGTAMGSVAILLKSKGHQISGSDQNLYAPMSERLEHAEIEVFKGYDAKRLEGLNPDIIVVGNVIGRGNEEAEWLLETRAVPFVSLPQLIGEQLVGNRTSIVITGTHGKTTTTALTTHLLKTHGVDPGHLIAGVPVDGSSSASIGNPACPFVIEGDEYDCAFFDKRSKFVHYYPRILVINNLEFDHGDIFRDLQDIQKSFSHLLRLVPRSGHVLIDGDDSSLVEWVTDESQARVWKIGFKAHNQLQITDFVEDPSGSRFGLNLNQTLWFKTDWKLAAKYNAMNAAFASLATALHLYPQCPEAYSGQGLSTFSSVKRRQQLQLDTPDLKIVEDFGHHPTAVGQTLESLKNRYAGHEIWCAFEPRSNTSRSPAFQSQWANAFKIADRTYIGAIHRIHLLQPNQRINTAAIESEINQSGGFARAYGDNRQLLEDILNDEKATKNPTLIVFFSNGAFDGIIQQAVDSFTQ